MQPYVDLEGSGIKTTLLRGALGSSFASPVALQGVINAATQSEIRGLSVRNTWTDSSAIGLLIDSANGALVQNVKSVAAGGALDSGAWKYGIVVRNSENVRLTHTVARGRSTDSTLCQGIAAFNSTLNVQDSRAVGAGDACGISIGLSALDSSQVQIVDSVIRGDGSLNGISVSGTASDAGSETRVRVRSSVLDGQVFGGTPGESGVTEVLISHSELTDSATGMVTCFGSHDPDLNALDAACMP